MKSKLVLMLALLCAKFAHGITIDTVSVGNPSNASDTTGFGSVADNYRIGEYEVTNEEYAEFLNAKAASDPLGLYATIMGDGVRGGIARSGVDGSYSYAVRENMVRKPVNYVTWYSAIRFANWLHNGGGDGDTESGAYTVLGGTRSPTNGNSITRSANARWFLPNENEWYKAAYYDPRSTAQAGPPGDDHYWRYPTSSDNDPIPATANSVGDISNPGVNVANYMATADWNGPTDGNVTTVGSAGLFSRSYYGTFDQGGNVEEWIDAPLAYLSTRIARGGKFNDPTTGLDARFRWTLVPDARSGNTGFRVATVVVPEPSALLLSTALLAILSTRRRKSVP